MNNNQPNPQVQEPREQFKKDHDFIDKHPRYEMAKYIREINYLYLREKIEEHFAKQTNLLRRNEKVVRDLYFLDTKLEGTLLKEMHELFDARAKDLEVLIKHMLNDDLRIISECVDILNDPRIEIENESFEKILKFFNSKKV